MPTAPAARPFGDQSLGSMSLFELPVSRGARLARVVAVLLLDVVLAGAGIAMMVSYFADRAEAAERARPVAVTLEPAPPVAEVDTLEPDTVDAEEVKREPAKRARKVGQSAVTRPRDPAPAGAGAGGGDEPWRDPDPAGTTAPDGPTGDIDMGGPPAGAGDSAGSVDDAEPPSGGSDPGSGSDPSSDPGAAGGDDGTLEPERDEAERVEFSAARVRREVDRHKIQLQKCYQRAAKTASPSKPLEGRVDLQFVIMPDGNASNVRPVANTTGSDQLATCVQGLIEGWQFPSPGAEEIAFVWPFVFKAP